MTTLFLYGIITIIFMVGVAFLMRRKYKVKFEEYEKRVGELSHDLKSAYVRFGQTFEHFVPFIKDFPQRDKAVFLGKPVDYIIFGDKIIFVEVKTGNSSLNANQKRIKRLVQEHKVEFFELRY